VEAVVETVFDFENPVEVQTDIPTIRTERAARRNAAPDR